LPFTIALHTVHHSRVLLRSSLACYVWFEHSIMLTIKSISTSNFSYELNQLSFTHSNREVSPQVLSLITKTQTKA
jgi:hypothetical protein